MRLNLNLTSQGINFKDKRKSLNSAEKRTLVNALDTIDSEVENGKKRADKLNSRNECLPVFLTLPFLLVSFNKLSPSKFLALLFGMIGIGAATFGLSNKKYAQTIFENEILAQKKSGMFETENSSKNDLSNPNLFLPITDTKQKQIDEMEVVKEIKSKKYSDKSLDIFISPFSKENHEYSQELNNVKKVYKTEKPVLSDVSEAVKQIDDSAKDYSKKALIGINSILALASVAGIGLTTLLQKSNKTLPKSIKNVFIIDLLFEILPLAPMFGLMLVADSNIVKDVDKISRYKAKEDFLKNSNMQNDKLSFAKKSIFETTIDYFKTRKEYKQKIGQQKDLILIKNDILANSKPSKEEINEAKEFKTKFYNAINSEKRIENKRREKLEETISNRYLYYLLIEPILIMLMKNILQKSKLNYIAGGILSGTFVTQALLNYYTKDK